MSDNHEPLSVTNLRRIWNLKKSEMQITQAEAAKKLGWTQGAFSQYLNNLTSLNPAAVIKLANFLGVDPKEIDPDINEHLPNLHKIEIRYRISNLNTRMHGVVTYDDLSSSLFGVLIDKPLPEFPTLPTGAILLCYPNPVKPIVKTTDTKQLIYVIRRKGSDKLEMSTDANCPSTSKLKSKWLVNSILLH